MTSQPSLPGMPMSEDMMWELERQAYITYPSVEQVWNSYREDWDYVQVDKTTFSFQKLIRLVEKHHGVV